ncbi:MAG: TIGR03960 family B12-binding radical SAM protein [bacterium]
MKDLLEKKFFPFVIKPGRYAGGEPGQIVKDPTDRLSYLHAFPDKYEIGHSFIGLQSLYHIINKDDRFLCERVFAVDRDAEQIMRRENIRLFSLESKRPAAEFDAIGFSLTYPLVFTNLLAMLDLAGIPLCSLDRTDEQPLILAGGPAVYNPEPIADFVDLFFIGDAEEGLPEILQILYNMKSASRQDKLEQIVRQVESVYVPRFYDADRRPLVDFAPERIRARVIKELKPEYFPDQPLVPLIETVHNHLSVEIMRGCPGGCRFCQAGPIYRPVRPRPQHDVINQITQQLAASGYDEVSLVSLSTSDYPNIEQLATTLSRRLEPSRVSISMPSLRPGTIKAPLLDAIRRVRRAGLTIAPEAGTRRLRRFIRKDISDEEIYETVQMAFQKGWTSVKLYFMIGLPTETEEDLQGIVKIIEAVSDIGRAGQGKKSIKVTLSPFIPEPHTPFQWDEMLRPEEILRRLSFVKRRCRHRPVHFKHNSCESAMLQMLLVRGGREMGNVILSANRDGCRFDAWSEEFEPSKWLTALQENKIEMEQTLKEIPFTAELPWSHIEKGPSPAHLLKERQRHLSESGQPSPEPSPPTVETGRPTPQMEFGRGKKKAADRSPVAPTKNRVRIRWGKDRSYRFMSHLDNIRAFERALRRAGLPVAYSQGFNPGMKLSFGPPLPLGFTSEAELVDITLETNLIPDMIDKLKQALPDGMEVFEARTVLAKSRSLSSALNRVVYSLPLAALNDGSDIDFSRLLRENRLFVERIGKSGTKTVDIRPALYDIIAEDENLVMILGIGDGGYVRPVEVLQLLDTGRDIKQLSYCIHRRELYRLDEQEQKISAMDI